MRRAAARRRRDALEDGSQWETQASEPRVVYADASEAKPSVLTVCGTCADTRHAGEDGLGGGARLQDWISDQLDDHPLQALVTLRRQRCLMSCSEGCVVAAAGRGKMQYLLGRLTATEETAAKTLDFAALHALSITGVVPNHDWPRGLAMHFIGRIPPFDPVDADWRDDGCDL